MSTPQLYRQLLDQLSQWITPKDHRHLKNCAEIVAAILQSESACLAHWIPFLTHRDCQARAQMERLSYFMHNPSICQEIFYRPLIKYFLQEWKEKEMLLVIDTSMFWDTYCLIEVCLAWGGRSITLAQTVIEHGSATVGFNQYLPVLEAAQALLPEGSHPTLLADRGFEHGELMRWLTKQEWDWAIRVKSDLLVTLGNGRQQSIHELFALPDQVNLYSDVVVLGDVKCNLGTANSDEAEEPWAVLTSTALSLQTFRLYGERFGGVEPHFKDYKSGTFDISKSKIRNAQALGKVLMMLEIAQLLAIRLGLVVIETETRTVLDWHGDRGLSLLQLGIREVKRLCYNALVFPLLAPIPWSKILPACASHRKRAQLDRRIQFSKVVTFCF
jgi:Transposase DDE domain